MQVTGLPLHRFIAITREVSDLHYGGNIVVHQDAHALSGNRFRGRLGVKDSRGPGARRSWSGRRMPATCWHGYRDVLRAVFTEYPEATVRTSMATYRGMAGFLADYPATADANVGSIMEPVTMPELCECSVARRTEEVGHHRRAALAELNQERQMREFVALVEGSIRPTSVHASGVDSMRADTSQPYPV